MVGNDCEIIQYLHCSLCMEERPDGVSMKEYSNYELGWTPNGLQMWCIRHDCNIMHIDFEGQTHPANLSRKKTPEEIRRNIKLVKPGEENEPTTRHKG